MLYWGLHMKKKNIFVKLLGAFLVPIVMMIVLGVVSYETASKSTMEKYEQSAGSTVVSVAEYMKLLTQTVELSLIHIYIRILAVSHYTYEYVSL